MSTSCCCRLRQGDQWVDGSGHALYRRPCHHERHRARLVGRGEDRRWYSATVASLRSARRATQTFPTACTRSEHRSVQRHFGRCFELHEANTCFTSRSQNGHIADLFVCQAITSNFRSPRKKLPLQKERTHRLRLLSFWEWQAEPVYIFDHAPGHITQLLQR